MKKRLFASLGLLLFLTLSFSGIPTSTEASTSYSNAHFGTAYRIFDYNFPPCVGSGGNCIEKKKDIEIK